MPVEPHRGEQAVQNQRGQRGRRSQANAKRPKRILKPQEQAARFSPELQHVDMSEIRSTERGGHGEAHVKASWTVAAISSLRINCLPIPRTTLDRGRIEPGRRKSRRDCPATAPSNERPTRVSAFGDFRQPSATRKVIRPGSGFRQPCGQPQRMPAQIFVYTVEQRNRTKDIRWS